MADKKISALTGATTPLAGTEVLPIVQSGATVKVAVSDLTAGRAMAALGMTLTSTDAGATAAPTIDLYRDSATPAASDTLGEIEFNGEDSAGNKQAYGVIHASILSPTSTAEQGQLHFETATAGALTEKMIIGTTNLVINDIGAVFNVRIEGDTDANLFYTDATNSRVGIGTASPSSKLHVSGGNLNVTAAAASSAVVTITGVNTAGSNAQIAMSLPGADSMTMTYVRSATPAFEIVNSSAGVSLAYGGNSWASLSDERHKDIIAPIGNAVSAVGTLRAVIGKYKSDKEGTRRSFLIAQDVQSVFPEAVDSSDQDFLKLSYTDVIPLLVAAINELSLEVAALKSK
jgi:hypothetical protein